MPDLPEPGSQWICLKPGEDYLTVWHIARRYPGANAVRIVLKWGIEDYPSLSDLHRDFTPAGPITLDWLAGMPGWEVAAPHGKHPAWAYNVVRTSDDVDGEMNVTWYPDCGAGLMFQCEHAGGTEEMRLPGVVDRLTLLWAVRLFRGA